MSEAQRLLSIKTFAMDSRCGCCGDWFETKNLIWVPEKYPRRGTLCRHYKGGLYVVLGYANWPTERTDGRAFPPPCQRRQDGLPSEPVVMYMAVETGVIWVRDISEWQEEVEVAGMKRPRFQKFAGGPK